MQIMPDIPENKRGLNYWANPPWLSIINRQQNYINETKVFSAAAAKGTRGGRAIRVRHPDDKVRKYKSKAEFGRFLGYKEPAGAGVVNAIRIGKKLKSGNVKIGTMKGKFIIMEEKIDSEKSSVRDTKQSATWD